MAFHYGRQASEAISELGAIIRRLDVLDIVFGVMRCWRRKKNGLFLRKGPHPEKV